MALVGLYPHQEEEVEHYAEPSRVLWWSPRSGKTRATVLAMRKAHLKLGYTRFLVVAPGLAAATTWRDELATEWPIAVVVDLIGGPITPREDAIFARFRGAGGPPTPPGVPEVIVINTEALVPLSAALLAWGPQGVVADEIHLFKTPGAKRTRALARLGDRASWRRGLTGTPTPKSYADCYGQYRFLDPQVFGTNFSKFRSRYLVVHPTWPTKVIGYTNFDELQSRAHSIASIVDRREAIGIPDELNVEQQIVLTPSVWKKYERLAKEHVLDSGEGAVSYSHQLSRLSALQQFASGFIYDGDGGATWVHTQKIDALMDELEEFIESQEPVVVFFRYRAEGDKILETIKQRYGERAATLVDGRSTQAEKVYALTHFGRPGEPLVLVMQEQVGSLGISLARSNACIFYSHSFDYATFTQARDRIWKPLGRILYIYLRVKDTADYAAKAAVTQKQEAEDKWLSFEDAAFGKVA